MREIKFRAFYKPQKAMINADKIESINFEVKTLGVYVPFGFKSYWKLRMSDFELMQYTGLKDKNGKEIYESDIVELIIPDIPFVIQGNGYSDVDTEKGFKTCGIVKFLYSCWFIDKGEGKGCPLDFDEKQQLEVIGNIYENTDLCKGCGRVTSSEVCFYIDCSKFMEGL